MHITIDKFIITNDAQAYDMIEKQNVPHQSAIYSCCGAEDIIKVVHIFARFYRAYAPWNFQAVWHNYFCLENFYFIFKFTNYSIVALFNRIMCNDFLRLNEAKNSI